MRGKRLEEVREDRMPSQVSLFTVRAGTKEGFGTNHASEPRLALMAFTRLTFSRNGVVHVSMHSGANSYRRPNNSRAFAN